MVCEHSRWKGRERNGKEWKGRGKEWKGMGRESALASAPQNKGSRLSKDWTLSSENFSFAEAKGIPPPLIQAEAEKFRDHWIAKPGKDGVKLDWDATWRTWVAKACEWG